MRVMVTGGTGFIGRHLCEALGRSRHDVFITGRAARPDWLDARIGYARTDYSAMCLKMITHLFEPDAICHLAGVSLIKEAGEAVVDANVLATENLLRAAPRGCRFLFASSAAVYGDAEICTEATLVKPTSVYGCTKAAAEQLVNAATLRGDVRGANLRLVANVGRHATHGLVYDVVRKLRGESPALQLIGERPGSCKPFLHVDETVSAFQFLLGLDHAGPFNVSRHSMLSLTVESVAGLVMNAVGVRKPIEWLGWGANWAGDNRSLAVLPQRLGELLWEPFYKHHADAVSAGARELFRELS